MQLVAVKVPRSDAPRDINHLWMRELLVSMNLDHINVVRLLGYYYAHMEALAVSSSYAQDDWVRWGTANQTRATNMKANILLNA